MFSRAIVASAVLLIVLATACATGGPTPTSPADEGKEMVLPGTAAIAEEGVAFYNDGHYNAALERFKEAQTSHDKPSWALEGWMGNACLALEDYEAAIEHYDNAVDINGSAVAYTLRSIAYIESDQCEPAIQDASTVLTLEPRLSNGQHTHAEAHFTLAICHAYTTGNTALALQHAEAGLTIAVEQEYPQDDIDVLKDIRDAVEGGRGSE